MFQYQSNIHVQPINKNIYGLFAFYGNAQNIYVCKANRAIVENICIMLQQRVMINKWRNLPNDASVIQY